MITDMCDVPAPTGSVPAVEVATTSSARRRHLAVLTPGAGLVHRLGDSLCHQQVGDQAWIDDYWATASRTPIIKDLPECKPCAKVNLKREASRG